MIAKDGTICLKCVGIGFWSDVVKSKRIVLIAAAMLVLSIKEAVSCADGLTCAVVKETPDGFVALRSKPNANARTVSKLQPYDILVVEESDCELPNWTRVFCVSRLDGECSIDKSYTTGWVHKKLIRTTACPKDMN
jgi:hypothetical protein